MAERDLKVVYATKGKKLKLADLKVECSNLQHQQHLGTEETQNTGVCELTYQIIA